MYREAITAFNDAAFDSSRWSSALEALAHATGSAGAILIPQEGRMPLMPYSASLEDVCRDYVGHGWVDRDERYNAWGTIIRQSVATELDFTTAEQMDRHPYWQEFLAPHGLRWWAGVKITFGSDVWIASIQRTPEQGPFLPEEIERLKMLSPHLSAAAAFASALDFARLEAASSAFQASGRAVLFLNDRGRVVRLNGAAEALLGEDLQVKNGAILSSSREATATLNRMIHNLLDTDTPLKAPVVVPLPRRNCRSLIALLSRPSRAMFDILSRCRCIVSLIDLEAPSEVVPDVMKAALGLSNAEVRLVNQLLRGVGVTEAAAGVGISYETARSSLKNIYGKLDVSGRSELTSLAGKIKEHLISTE